MLDFLKNVPNMTNTPEITMHEEAPKTSIADRVREITMHESSPKTPMTRRIRNYKSANPNATAKQIADAVGTTTVYVYQTLSSPQKQVKAAKKSADPLVASKHKTEGFAIGVNQPHYWVISALASGKKTSRSAILRDIIDQYIRDVLTEVKSDGTPV
jgi:hypothetical protein